MSDRETVKIDGKEINVPIGLLGEVTCAMCGQRMDWTCCLTGTHLRYLGPPIDCPILAALRAKENDNE